MIVAAGGAALALVSSAPATAGTVTTLDQFGAVDFDAACVISTDLNVPEANNIGSPGMGCQGITSYDGSTAGTDLYELTMDSTAVVRGPSNVQLGAEFLIAGVAPLPGSTCPRYGTCFDLPNDSFVGAGYKALFQNPLDQNNLPTNPLGGGCRGFWPVFDQHGHWHDGYHHFIGLDVVWNGFTWIWSAQVGTYDPSPGGGFFFTELGVNDGVDSDWDGSLWDNSDPNARVNVHWSVTAKVLTTTVPPLLLIRVLVDGVLPSANILCSTGVFNTVYAKAGDPIVNIKGLTTANQTVTLPVTMPLSLIPGQSDITSLGGFIFYSDITHGNSRNNGVGAVLATAGGDNPATACVNEGILGNRLCVSYTAGLFGPLGAPDTLGDSPACPTPTFGGLLPTNPFKNPNVGCQYDDDNIPVPSLGAPGGPWTAIDPGERGTFLPEWWDTILRFTA